MKEKSIGESYFFNLIKTLSNMLFPILTFTYSTRILGVEGVGKVNFTKAIITYFIQIATLGINYYGTREAAKRKNNKNELSKYVQEMLIINSITTVLSYILLVIAIITVPKFQDYKLLLLINSFAILLQGVGMEWLYQALEEYKYIAIRSVFFQVIALGLMYVTVKTKNDVFFYALISVIASSGSYILNIINIKKHVSFAKFLQYDIKRHFKPIAWLFAMEVSIELYTVLDTTMLGVFCGDIAVGKYTAAIKINKLIIRLITSLGVVLIPRISYYVEMHEINKIKDLIKKAYNYVFLLSIPASVGICTLSDEIILLFSGKEFISASFTMKILAPIILVIPFSVVTNNQIFVPMGKEKLIVYSTCVGALTNFVCNIFLIPHYAENGAAIATVLAETMVAIVCFRNIRKYYDLKLIYREYYQYWIASFPIYFISIFIKQMKLYYIMQIVLTVIWASFCYFIILVLFNNSYFINVLNVMKRKFRNIV